MGYPNRSVVAVAPDGRLERGFASRITGMQDAREESALGAQPRPLLERPQHPVDDLLVNTEHDEVGVGVE